MSLRSALASMISEVRGSKSLRVTHTSGVPLQRARHVLVLDSSFNPPTIAHRSLALAGNHLYDDTHPAPDTIAGEEVSHKHDEISPPDAILLLLSVTNADKVPKPGDASAEQRLEMMQRLAEALHHAPAPTSSTSVTYARPHSVAVAAIDAPTFVEKAAVLRSAFTYSSDNIPRRYTFVLGTDTLIRVLDSKYYGGTSSGRDAALSAFFGTEGCTSIMCADRPDLLASSDASLSSAVEEYARKGQVRFVQLPDSAHGVSSSAVRQAVAVGSENGANHWKSMVEPAIADFVEKNGLYRHDTDAKM